MSDWGMQKAALGERLMAGRRHAKGKIVPLPSLPAFLKAAIRSGDRVCLEGDNQKQADILASALANLDPADVHDLHMVQSGVVLPAHLDVFEKGIARRLGYPRARLDTGPKQVSALGLYQDEGYAEVPDFNGNPVAVFWGEKRL